LRGGAAGTVIVVSADRGLRQRLASGLAALRWQVREANGGAEAMLRLGACGCEAMLLDTWLPDLEAAEFADHVRLMYPAMDVIGLDGAWRESLTVQPGESRRNDRGRSSRRNELLHAMREALEPDAARRAAVATPAEPAGLRAAGAYRKAEDGTMTDGSLPAGTTVARSAFARTAAERPPVAGRKELLPELVGSGQAMRELARLVRLVAPRSTTVLIEGETGTGKEVVARALHRLSRRAAKPFVVLNCAAIPESLLEAELFGHTRGAFTGAVQSRVGRIEAANGGTLLLDEIGEMPIGMQAKMLRFLESGELQRVGENDLLRVDVRLIAATHQPLEQRSAEGRFRLDLYHRLAVFPIEVPALRERMEDVAELAEHFLERMGRESPRKRLAPEALAALWRHRWPGNVRELMHVLERAAILAGESPEIAAADVRYRRAARA
jgi:DNA-binding NtrC family response regulator